MAGRIAATLSLIAFAGSLLAGLVVADNPLATVVVRALWAMGGTFVVGLAVGWMAERLVREAMTNDAEAASRRNREAIERARAEAAGADSGP